RRSNKCLQESPRNGRFHARFAGVILSQHEFAESVCLIVPKLSKGGLATIKINKGKTVEGFRITRILVENFLILRNRSIVLLQFRQNSTQNMACFFALGLDTNGPFEQR